MDKNTNSINWFEIPAADINRATKFYETIFDIKMEQSEMMGMKMEMFPSDSSNGKASGALVQSHVHKPSQEGVMVYLNANPKMDDIIGRIEQAGGKVTMPKTQITPEIGYMGFFIDTEGNKIALHSQG